MEESGIKLIAHKYELVLKHPFKVTYGTRTHQPTLVIELQYKEVSGFGESAAIFYYKCDREAWIQRIQQVQAVLSNYTFTTPEDLWEHLNPQIGDDTFLQNMIDQAAHDWYGKHLGRPSHAIWNLEMKNLPQSSFTIALDTIEVMVQKIKEEDWPCYKIKLESENAIEMVTELRKHTKSVFRVDANCGWTVKQTIDYALILKELGVEFIEQPLKKDQIDEMEEVMKQAVLPIIADESCCVESDLDRCIGKFHGVNIKLTKCGGITPALRMIRKAKEKGLKVMLGCMVEGTVGISAIAQLLPLLDYVDMDGAALITKESDNATGVELKPDGLHFPEGLTGLGAKIKPSPIN